MKTEQQIRQIRALVNTLMVLKRNTKATKYLKGQHILGSLRHADKIVRVNQNRHMPDEICFHMLNQIIEHLTKMLKTSNELISGESIYIG